jgi:hypothetical protein
MEFVNKVANSGLITLDPAEWMPTTASVELDIKDCLYMGLILKEKDFRQWIKDHDWSVYKDKAVAVFCSADAIIPTWAYMLLASALQPFAVKVVFGNKQALEAVLFEEALLNINPEDFRDQRIVIKGCGDVEISPAAYVILTSKLAPVVKSIMFGEPCSTVPILKNK